MLELAGDLGLLEEATPGLGVGSLFGQDLLECDLAPEVAIVREPDPAKPSPGVHSGKRVPGLLGSAGRDDGLNQDVSGSGWKAAERLADLGVFDAADGVACLGAGECGEGGASAAVLLDLAPDLAVDGDSVGLADPAAFEEQIGQRLANRAAQPAQTSTNRSWSIRSSWNAMTANRRLRSMSVSAMKIQSPGRHVVLE